MSGPRLISAFGLVVIFCQATILSAQIVPVLFFRGETSESRPSVDAFETISKDRFAELVEEEVGGSPVVIYIKDNLCVEDLSHGNLNLPFKTHYLPSVDSALSILENLRSYNVSREEQPESISKGQLIIVPVSDVVDVPEIYAELRSTSPDVIGAITGASCSYSRSQRTRRATTGRDDSTDETIAQADRVLLYTTEPIQQKTETDTEYSSLGQPTIVSSVANESHSLRLDLTFSTAVLRLQFSATLTNYWYLDSIEYEANSTVVPLYSDSKLFFPYNFSYHCAKDTIFYNGTTYINFPDIQVQIDPKTSATTGAYVFSDGYDCIGFTSIPIWSGIFVTFILALIVIWGLTMIMDIRTMDRFDDPKGKTITITGTD